MGPRVPSLNDASLRDGGKIGGRREQVRHRSACAPGRGPALHHRPRPLCRRFRAAAPMLRRRDHVAACARAHQRHRHRQGEGRRRRARGADRRRCASRQARSARPADARRYGRPERISFAAQHPGGRQGACGRRARRLCGCGDASAGAQRRRAGRDRLRAAAGGHHGRGRGETRRAGAMGRSAEQCLVHADDGQQGRDRRRDGCRQARRHAQAQQFPHHRQLDRDARRDRALSS